MAAPTVHVGPEPSPILVDAVRRGGGVVTQTAGDADAVVWLGTPAQLAPLLTPRVRWVQLPFAGVERWLASGLLGPGPERVWTSATGVYAELVAEHALALTLAGIRRLPESARATSWDHALEGGTLFGATVAIVGAGEIGRALIALLAPFRARILAVTRRGLPVPGADETLPAERVAEVWPRADVVVLAAPATAATRRLLDARALRALPAHALVVNVARGSLVDLDALTHALAAGELGGAALDVTDPEPLPDKHPLWREPRALITPHVANPPALSDVPLAARIADNVARFRDGRELIGVVDAARGY